MDVLCIYNRCTYARLSVCLTVCLVLGLLGLNASETQEQPGPYRGGDYDDIGDDDNDDDDDPKMVFGETCAQSKNRVRTTAV